jgi:DNA-binding beta-propeller fold protein YncE
VNLKPKATLLLPSKSNTLAMIFRTSLHPTGLFAVCTVLCCSLLACTASADEVRPPSDQFFFPTGVALTPDESGLAVANANSELRFDSGTLLMVDTAKVDIAVAAWVASKTIPNGCKRDPLSPDTLECDEAAFLKPDTSVRIGNFATNMATQDFGNGAYRFVVPVRGDPSITWVDGNASTLTCTSGDTAFALCDDNHRLTTVQNDDSIGILGDEPYGVYADSQAGYAVIAHLTTGALTLIDSTLNQGAQIADIQTGIFASDSTGLRGATAVAGRTPGAVDGLVYAVSRSEDRVEMLTVARQTGNNAPFLLPSGYFFLDSVGNTSGGSSDSRGLAFSQNGDRLFVLNRRPPTVQVYDTSLDVTGVPRNKGISATDVCRNASGFTVANVGDGDRAFVSCFAEGSIVVVDPRGGTAVSAVINVGRGPYAMAVSSIHQKLFVSNFLEDTVAVVDLRPGVLSSNRVVMRIGERKP